MPGPTTLLLYDTRDSSLSSVSCPRKLMKAEWDCGAPGAELGHQKYRCRSLVAGTRVGLGLAL